MSETAGRAAAPEGDAAPLGGWRAAAVAALGLGACAIDLWIRNDFPGAPWGWGDLAGSELRIDLIWAAMRVLVAALVIAGAAALGLPRSAFGLLRRPRQSLGYWLRATAIICGVAVVCLGIAAGVFYALDVGTLEGQAYRDDPAYLAGSWVIAPVFEEVVYRLLLVTTVAAAVGRWPALLLSAVLFAALHLPMIAPNHIAAGALLGWAYLKSGTLAVPVALHAAGNVLVWISSAATR